MQSKTQSRLILSLAVLLGLSLAAGKAGATGRSAAGGAEGWRAGREGATAEFSLARLIGVFDEKVAAVVYKPRDLTFPGNRSIASGALSVSNPIDSDTSSCPRTLSLSKRCATSWGYICILPVAPWFCAWTRRARSRHWSGANPCFSSVWVTWKM